MLPAGKGSRVARSRGRTFRGEDYGCYCKTITTKHLAAHLAYAHLKSGAILVSIRHHLLRDLLHPLRPAQSADIHGTLVR